MRITGMPYRIVDHMNEGSNVRSYLHDPTRAVDAERYERAFQPTEGMIRTMHDVLDSNPLWRSMVRTGATDPAARTGRLELHWPSETQTLRAFTFVPSVGTPGPRSVYVTWGDDDPACRVSASAPRHCVAALACRLWLEWE